MVFRKRGGRSVLRKVSRTGGRMLGKQVAKRVPGGRATMMGVQMARGKSLQNAAINSYLPGGKRTAGILKNVATRYYIE